MGLFDCEIKKDHLRRGGEKTGMLKTLRHTFIATMQAATGNY